MLFLTAYNSAGRTEVNESKIMESFRNETLLNEHCLVAQPRLTLNAVETANLIKKEFITVHTVMCNKKRAPTRKKLEQNVLSQQQSKFTGSTKEVIRNKTDFIFTMTMENIRTLTKTSNLHSYSKKILII